MDMRTIGFNVEKYCASNNISLEDICKIAKCEIADVPKMFDGRMVIPSSTLKAIADIKGVNVSLFFKESNERFDRIVCMSSSSQEFKRNYGKWDSALDIIDYYCYLKEIQ